MSLQCVRGIDASPEIAPHALSGVVKITPVSSMAPGPRRRRPEKYSYVIPGLRSRSKPFTFRSSFPNAYTALTERVLFNKIDGVWKRPRYPSVAYVFNCLKPF